MSFVANLARRAAGTLPTVAPRPPSEPHFDVPPPLASELGAGASDAVSAPGRVHASTPLLGQATAATVPPVVHTDKPPALLDVTTPPEREPAPPHAPPSLPLVPDPHVIQSPPLKSADAAEMPVKPHPTTVPAPHVEPAPGARQMPAALTHLAGEPERAATPRALDLAVEARHLKRDESAAGTPAPQVTAALARIEPRVRDMPEREPLARRALAAAIPVPERTAPRIQIRIGQIQVRMQKPPPPRPRPAAPPRTTHGFDDFARARAYVDRLY